VTFYDDVAPLAMLATVPESAGRFSRRTLGALADQTAGKLRETVRAVLQGEGDAETVAAGLGIHKNTVRARARDLLLALDYYDAFLAAEDSDS
jgi:sugar diacid utilization regulator